MKMVPIGKMSKKATREAVKNNVLPSSRIRDTIAVGKKRRVTA